MSVSETGIQATVPPPAGESIERRVRRQQSPFVKGLLFALDAVSSLRLTVILFALSILLIFFGTLAQVDGGIWTIVNKYFRSVVVWVPFDDLVLHAFHVPGGFLFPGGWLLGSLLMTNLLAAHVKLIASGYKKWASGRLGFPWRLPGILLIHSGLVVLMVSEFITGMYAHEGNMSIREGQSTNVVDENRFSELVFSDPADPKFINEVVVPGSWLQHQKKISHKDVPVDIEVLKFFVNSDIKDAPPGDPRRPTDFVGDIIAIEHAEVAGTSQEQTNDVPSVYVKLKDKKTGRSLGTYMYSAWLKPRPLTIGGKTYEVALRFKRTYRPFSIHLIDFRFDRWPGTDRPRNYSSTVILEDPEKGLTTEEIVIKMNEPLRWRGETFFQASFEKDETGTVLQVVRNPGWVMPYIACVMVALGMLVHFSILLVRFVTKTITAQAEVAI